MSLKQNQAPKPLSSLIGKVLFVCLIILAGTLYWFADIKFKDIVTHTGFDKEAKQNPYLAAKLFLQQSHAQRDANRDWVETQSGFGLIESLPTTKDTIIITSARYSMSERRNTLLHQWLHDGGHLVVVAKMLYNDNIDGSGDALIDRFDIQVHEADTSNSDSDDDADSESDSQNDDIKNNQPTKPPAEETIGDMLARQAQQSQQKCSQQPLLSPLTLGDGYPDAQVYIDSPNVLAYPNLDETAFWSSDGYGPQLIQLLVGEGKLTVLTDMRLWNNHQLGCFDNALLLQQLTDKRAKTWILFHEDMPSFIDLLWQKNHSLVVSGLLLLLIWLWSQTLRFGAIHTTAHRIRRNFSEHIAASAQYRWRSGQSQQIIDQLRQQITHKVSLRHADFSQMSQTQQIALIERLSHLNSSQIHDALFSPVALKNPLIIDQVQRLQQLRKQLC